MITNGTEAKELLLGAATALSNQWSPSAIKKLEYLAERIEKDFGKHEVVLSMIGELEMTQDFIENHCEVVTERKNEN